MIAAAVFIVLAFTDTGHQVLRGWVVREDVAAVDLLAPGSASEGGMDDALWFVQPAPGGVTKDPAAVEGVIGLLRRTSVRLEGISEAPPTRRDDVAYVLHRYDEKLGRTVCVLADGSLRITVERSEYRKKSPLGYLWWRFDRPGDGLQVVYATAPDPTVLAAVHAAWEAAEDRSVGRRNALAGAIGRPQSRE